MEVYEDAPEAQRYRESYAHVGCLRRFLVEISLVELLVARFLVHTYLPTHDFI